MNHAELEHAIRATCDLIGEEVVIVFGSQAILGQYPDAPEGVRQSIEADVAPVSNDEATATLIDANLGEGSPFHATHGFYVHGLTLPASLPRGRERRTIDLKTRGTNQMTGRCIEAHDLAASKLAAFRDKDREFARVLIAERLVDVNRLRLRVRQLQASDVPVERILRWIDRTVVDLSS